MTEYEQLLNQLHARPKASAVPTLERMCRLMAELGNPQERLRCIHITGTNGKGSTAAYTAAVLEHAGFRTGLLTSPYLVDFRERFQVNRQLICQTDFCRIDKQVLSAEQRAGSVNEFEFVTAVAFCWFAEQNCDYVVLEAGMGGAYDATNLISHPVCTCITQVSLDHMALLGNTVAEIARNKAGIVKAGIPLVTPYTQHPSALAVFHAVCAQQQAPLCITQVPETSDCRYDGSEMVYRGTALKIPLPGAHQLTNAACAFELCRCLGLAPEVIAAGIAKTVWPGRLQILSKSPLVLTDAGHNPDGIAALCQALDTLYQGFSLHVIMTMMQDKAYQGCISSMAQRAERFYACTLDLPRALTPEQVARVACPFCAKTEQARSLQEALALARPHLQENTLLVICGSVYLSGQAVEFFSNSSF